MKIPHFLKPNRTLPADHLMVDDWFRMGGETYRVVQLHPNANWTLAIDAAQFGPDTPSNRTVTITVPNKLRFKIYNQQ